MAAWLNPELGSLSLALGLQAFLASPVREIPLYLGSWLGVEHTVNSPCEPSAVCFLVPCQVK